MTVAEIKWLIALPFLLLLLFIFSLYFQSCRRKLLERWGRSLHRLKLVESEQRWRVSLRKGMWIVSFILLVFALARPQWGFYLEKRQHQGLNLLFALDTSKSMLAEDVRPNRLELAKLSILELVNLLAGNRVGLIAFAGNAFLQCPVTADYGAFKLSLKALDTQIIPKGGTHIASAIRMAEQAFEAGNSYKRLILMTDGEDLEGSALEAAKDAAKKGIVVYTVGIGSPKGSPITFRTPEGRNQRLKDAKGEPVITRLDEGMLQKIAQETQGFYVPLGNAGEGLKQIYETTLRHLPKESFESVEKKPVERYGFFAGFALLGFFLESLMRVQRKKKKV